MRGLRRLVACLAAVLTLLSPPVVAAATGAAHHAHGDAAPAGAVDHAGHCDQDGQAPHRHGLAHAEGDAPSGAAADDEGQGTLRCQLACGALQSLPAAVGRPSAAGIRSPPDAVVLHPVGRRAAPEPPPPRAL